MLKRCLMDCPCIITLFLYVSVYYVYLLLIPLYSTPAIVTISVLFNIFFLLSLASFFASMFINPGETPENFSLDSIPEDEKESLSEDYIESDFSLGRVTFCKKCEKYRPPRSHHCSICEKCVLRFDHHCPFIANCVGYRNQKAFVLFLLYTAFGLGVLSVVVVLNTYDVWNTEWIIGSIVCVVLFFYIIGFGLTQLWMLCVNSTTLEFEWKQNIFDLGSCERNLGQILGHDKVYWVLPFLSKDKVVICYPIVLRNKSGGVTKIFNKFLV